MSWYSCRRGPLQGPELGLLEAEMSRVFGLGYSWPDTYAQCVFQTLLYNIELRWVLSTALCPPHCPVSPVFRQQYDKQQCRHLLEDTDDTEGEEDPILFVPEPDDDSLTHTEHKLTAEEEEQNWLQLQNVSTLAPPCSSDKKNQRAERHVKYIMFDINNCTKTSTRSINVIAACRDYLLTASP